MRINNRDTIDKFILMHAYHARCKTTTLKLYTKIHAFLYLRIIIRYSSMFSLLCKNNSHGSPEHNNDIQSIFSCLLYTSDAADEEDSVDLGGRRIIKKKI